MKKLVLATVALVSLSGAALAEPAKLSDSQLESTAAGLFNLNNVWTGNFANAINTSTAAGLLLGIGNAGSGSVQNQANVVTVLNGL